MKGPLYLSSSNSNPVTVSSKIVQHLCQYQVDGIRFLYQQLFDKGQNAVLNYEIGMNIARIISALLSTKKENCSLIICEHNSFCTWYYELSNISGLKVMTANDLVKEESSGSDYDKPDAVLITQNQLKHIKLLPIEEWFIVIVNDLDLLIKSRNIKGIISDFRIASTTYNFLVNPSSELQWNIMKWTNPNLIEDKEIFLETEELCRKKFLNVFPDYWKRLTWFIFEADKPNDDAVTNYDKFVNEWCNKNNIKLPTDEKKKCKTSSKRKSSSKKIKKEEQDSDTSEFSSEETVERNLSSSKTSINIEKNTKPIKSKARSNSTKLLNKRNLTARKQNANRNKKNKYIDVVNNYKDTIEEQPEAKQIYLNNNKDINLKMYDIQQEKEYSDIDDNPILNSLIDNTQLLSIKEEPVTLSNNEHSCAILDSLL